MEVSLAAMFIVQAFFSCTEFPSLSLSTTAEASEGMQTYEVEEYPEEEPGFGTPAPYESGSTLRLES